MTWKTEELGRSSTASLITRSTIDITQVLCTKVRIQNGGCDKAADGKSVGVEFRHVSFRYPGTGGDMLHDVSFTAKPGETVALIGATGSGKTSLVDLIPRFYDACSGEVLMDGVNVRDYEIHALREKIGYVSQKAAGA